MGLYFRTATMETFITLTVRHCSFQKYDLYEYNPIIIYTDPRATSVYVCGALVSVLSSVVLPLRSNVQCCELLVRILASSVPNILAREQYRIKGLAKVDVVSSLIFLLDFNAFDHSRNVRKNCDFHGKICCEFVSNFEFFLEYWLAISQSVCGLQYRHLASLRKCCQIKKPYSMIYVVEIIGTFNWDFFITDQALWPVLWNRIQNRRNCKFLP